MGTVIATPTRLESLHRVLIDHLEMTAPLTGAEATRIVGDMLDYFSEQAPEMVRRRHRELSAGGLTNPVVFERIRDELPLQRVMMPGLSLRQLRRIVYG